MRRIVWLAMWMALPWATPPAAATLCDPPPELIDSVVPMPVVAKALREGLLRVLVVGSASVFGPGGSGPTAAWPARFAARLQAARPALRVELQVHGTRGAMADTMRAQIEGLTPPYPHLVVWQVGAVEAARNIEPDWLARHVASGLTTLQSRSVDSVLMDQQFSRFIRVNADIDPYLATLRITAAAQGVAVLQRYALMRHWAETERIDIERTPREQRVAAADQLGTCLGAALGALVLDGAADADVAGIAPPAPAIQ